MSRSLLHTLRHRTPRWLALAWVLLLLCQQAALAAHVCVLERPQATQGCTDDMRAGGDDGMAPDCAAHCANPAQHGQDGVALSVPPLLPAVAETRTLVAAARPSPGDADDDPAERGWRRQHASTVLLI